MQLIVYAEDLGMLENMVNPTVPGSPPPSNGDMSAPNVVTSQKQFLNFLIIGAGSRGNAYASALTQCPSDVPICIAGIAEPVPSKRRAFVQKYARNRKRYPECHEYDTWQQYVSSEKDWQSRGFHEKASHVAIDGVFVCVLDEMHAEIITALAPLGLNIMSEKPLATTLSDCLSIYRSLQPPGMATPKAIFSIGHVLRYSPHNMLLRKLLLEERVIGDILSIEHTEPVGWWHFSHSYVR